MALQPTLMFVHLSAWADLGQFTCAHLCSHVRGSDKDEADKQSLHGQSPNSLAPQSRTETVRGADRWIVTDQICCRRFSDFQRFSRFNCVCLYGKWMNMLNMACHARHDDSQESWAFMLMDTLRPNSGSLQPFRCTFSLQS